MDQAVKQAVIESSPDPTVASRAYGMMHTTIFDAWAAYDPTAIATQLGDDLQRPATEITKTNKSEAMSFAAYRVLTELFPKQTEIFDELMTKLGLDLKNTNTDTTTSAGIGNVSAKALLEFRAQDGSNQTGENTNGATGVPYSDISDYIIHFEDGDLNGRLLGREIGQAVWSKALYFMQGGETQLETAYQPILGVADDDLFDPTNFNDNFSGDRNIIFAGLGGNLFDSITSIGISSTNYHARVKTNLNFHNIF